MRGLVVTHGDLGKELIASSALVLRSTVPLDALSNRDRGAAELVVTVEEWLKRDDGPSVIMVDDPSGSCGIASCRAAASRTDCWVLGGVNLAMVVTFLARGDELEGPQLVQKILERARSSIRILESGS